MKNVNAEYVLLKKAKPPDRDTHNIEPPDSLYAAFMVLVKGDKSQKGVAKGNDKEINVPTGSYGDHRLQETFSDQAQERFFPY